MLRQDFSHWEDTNLNVLTTLERNKKILSRPEQTKLLHFKLKVRGGSRAAATFKMERFVIIVKG